MIFAFPVKWLVMFLENDIMFFKFNVMFLSRRIMLPRLEFCFGCGAIFVLKRRITKMAPQGVQHLNRIDLIDQHNWIPYGTIFIVLATLKKWPIQILRLKCCTFIIAQIFY